MKIKMSNELKERLDKIKIEIGVKEEMIDKKRKKLSNLGINISIDARSKVENILKQKELELKRLKNKYKQLEEELKKELS